MPTISGKSHKAPLLGSRVPYPSILNLRLVPSPGSIHKCHLSEVCLITATTAPLGVLAALIRQVLLSIRLLLCILYTIYIRLFLFWSYIFCWIYVLWRSLYSTVKLNIGEPSWTEMNCEYWMWTTELLNIVSCVILLPMCLHTVSYSRVGIRYTIVIVYRYTRIDRYTILRYTIR